MDAAVGDREAPGAGWLVVDLLEVQPVVEAALDTKTGWATRGTQECLWHCLAPTSEVLCQEVKMEGKHK